MPCPYIAVGTNVGNRLKNLKRAKELFAPEIKIITESAIYETLPVGGPPQGLYLNQVWKCETNLQPLDLLKKLQSVETKLGRRREIVNGPRTMDLDILEYDDVVMNTAALTLPHLRMHDREFVQRPLQDVKK